MEINSYIDFTLLKANATKEEVRHLCQTALKNNYQAVCVNPYMLETATKELFQTNVKVACVIGFPLGANTLRTKVFETIEALQLGADEIDCVINQCELRNLNEAYLIKEISQLKKVCEEKTLKIIVETCNLNDEQLKLACKACLVGGADFIKTSTGFLSGATPEVVEKIREYTENKIYIKASGGIKTKEQAISLIKAGAMRIGTSTELK